MSGPVESPGAVVGVWAEGAVSVAREVVHVGPGQVALFGDAVRWPGLAAAVAGTFGHGHAVGPAPAVFGHERQHVGRQQLGSPVLGAFVACLLERGDERKTFAQKCPYLESPTAYQTRGLASTEHFIVLLQSMGLWH